MRQLHFTLLLGLLGFAVVLFPDRRAVGQGRDERDLFAQNLKDWTRTGTGDNPWRLSAGRVLSCDRADDAYLVDEIFRDGTLKFEYRFVPTSEKTGYKAAVSVRRRLDTNGCKIALGDNCGELSVAFIGSTDRLKVLDVPPVDKFARPVGEWNLVEIKMTGREIEAFINGKSAASFDNCEESGLIALHAEGSAIEFRDATWKDATK
jgi:hypothetical protein